jgi:hypothetical protein
VQGFFKKWRFLFALFMDQYTLKRLFYQCFFTFQEALHKTGNRGCRKNAESDDQIPGKQTLGSLAQTDQPYYIVNTPSSL